jgi:putative aldouronate transport system substrate-binding protein
MFAAIAVGCGDTDTTPATTTGDAPAATTTDDGDTATTAPAGSDEMEEVTLRFIFGDAKRAATDEVWERISELTWDTIKAHFDVQFISFGDYSDRILTMAAAGESWDLNFDGEWLCFHAMANLGGYMALNDLMPVYAPNLWAAYQESGVLSAATFSGQIVGMPWGNVMNNRPYFQWRGDLIDANPADISTIEDVEALVYRIKEEYPDRYTVENVDLGTVMLKHNYMEIGDNFWFDYAAYQATGTITPVHVATTAGYLERAQIAERWQSDGLIWPDILIADEDHNMLIDHGRLITKFGTYEFARSDRAWLEDGSRWAFAELYPDHYYPHRSALANLVAIPRTSQHADRVLMFLDMLETNQELYDLVHYGILGLTYELNADGSARFPDGMDAGTSNFMLWQGRWGLWKPHFMRGDPEFRPGFWAEEFDHAMGNPFNINNPTGGFSFDAEAVIVEMSQIRPIYEAAEEMLNVGLAGPAAAAVNTLIADLDRAGLEAIIAEMQRQLDIHMGG